MGESVELGAAIAVGLLIAGWVFRKAISASRGRAWKATVTMIDDSSDNYIVYYRRDDGTEGKLGVDSSNAADPLLKLKSGDRLEKTSDDKLPQPVK